MSSIPLVHCMLRLFTLSFLALYPALSTAATAGQPGPLSPAELRYSRSHSLGENYVFDNRDGWQSVNISDMLYKYSTSTGKASQIGAEGGNYGFDSIWKRSGKNHKKNSGKRPEEKSGGLGGIADTVKNMFKGLKGIGKAQDVTITWFVDSHSYLIPDIKLAVLPEILGILAMISRIQAAGQNHSGRRRSVLS